MCRSCDFLTISRVVEDHIIDRHYIGLRVDERDSFFFANVLPARRLFADTTSIPRRNFEPGGKSGCYKIYFLPYDGDIGIFPYKVVPRLARKVKLVVGYVECRECRNLAPTSVVTMYPVWRVRNTAHFSSFPYFIALLHLLIIQCLTWFKNL